LVLVVDGDDDVTDVEGVTDVDGDDDVAVDDVAVDDVAVDDDGGSRPVDVPGLVSEAIEGRVPDVACPVEGSSEPHPLNTDMATANTRA
jgi:hypothetical protein